jgi:putative membrane protein
MLPIAIALHIFGVIFWLGGLLMIASLLSRVPEEVGIAKERILVQSRRLFEVFVNAGAAMTLVLGFTLIAMEPAVLKQGWLRLKLMLIVILLFYHVRFYRRIRELELKPSDARKSEFMFIHGALSLLLIAILGLVAIKPW